MKEPPDCCQILETRLARGFAALSLSLQTPVAWMTAKEGSEARRRLNKTSASMSRRFHRHDTFLMLKAVGADGSYAFPSGLDTLLQKDTPTDTCITIQLLFYK